MRRPSPRCSLPLRLIGVLAAGSALAMSCRSGGAGGPVVSADAIVEGFAPPTVHADTVDEPFTVSINRAHWTPHPRLSGPRDFWSDVAVLDMASAERAARSMDEKTFVVAMRTLMASDPDGAAIAFAALNANASDPRVRSRARVGLTMALSWRSDWVALSRLGADRDSAETSDDPVARQAGVERWARALAGSPPAEVTVPDEPVVLPMRRSAFGTPVVTVRINGKSREFWLDTGASMTLLSLPVALEAGVKLAAPDTLALGVVAGHIPARAVVIDSLELGPVIARGLGAAVVERSALRLDRQEVKGVAHAVPIDGVIGTDLLRHLDVVLDAGEGTITIRRPRRDPRAVRNLYWVGYPVVRLLTQDGRPILFGLDTGAEGTFVTTALLRKLPRTPVARRRMRLGGLGPKTEDTEWVVRDVRLSDGDYGLQFRNTPVTPDRRWTFVTFDGVMGSDVALSSRMHLDFTNGVFDVRPRERKEP